MPCNCGGGGIVAYPSAATATTAAAMPTGTRWKVTYSNGATMVFDHEWQARQAESRSGGTVERLDPQPVPEA
jgi:hypothetical protein